MFPLLLVSLGSAGYSPRSPTHGLCTSEETHHLPTWVLHLKFLAVSYDFNNIQFLVPADLHSLESGLAVGGGKSCELGGGESKMVGAACSCRRGGGREWWWGQWGSGGGLGQWTGLVLLCSKDFPLAPWTHPWAQCSCTLAFLGGDSYSGTQSSGDVSSSVPGSNVPAYFVVCSTGNKDSWGARIPFLSL